MLYILNVGQMYIDMYIPLKYHIQYFYCIKNLVFSIYSSLSFSSSTGNHLFFYIFLCFDFPEHHTLGITYNFFRLAFGFRQWRGAGSAEHSEGEIGLTRRLRAALGWQAWGVDIHPFIPKGGKRKYTI